MPSRGGMQRVPRRAGRSDSPARRVEVGGFLAHERLKGGRRMTEQPSQDVRITEEVMAAIARLDSADHPELVLEDARVGIAHARADEDLRVHAFDSDIAPKHLREYPADVMASEAVRSSELIGRGGMK